MATSFFKGPMLLLLAALLTQEWVFAHQPNGQCFCEENWKNLNGDQRNTLKVILEFFKSQKDIFTGQIEFLEISYSIDFIQTYLSINGKNIKTVNEIYFLSVLNFQKLNYGDISTDYTNIQYILSIINNSTSNENFKIWYRGYSFSVELVLEQFHARRINVAEVTTEILEEVLEIIVAPQLLNLESVTLPNNPNKNQEHALEIIQEFLITEGGQRSVTFEFFGAIIISEKIFDYTEEHEINISDIQVKEFYEIIQATVADPSDVNGDISNELTNIILYIQVQGDHPTGYFNYYGLNVSVDFCLTYLYLQGISVDQINTASIEMAILEYQKYTQKHEKSQDIVITLIVDQLNQGIETGSISYSGYVISITNIRQHLGNTVDITEQQVLQIIWTIIQAAPSTTEESTVQIPPHPNEEETKQLEIIVQIIQSGVCDEHATFQFLGIHISYLYVFEYLQQHNTPVESLSVQIIFEIIVEFVNDANTSGTSAGETNTGDTTPEETQTVITGGTGAGKTTPGETATDLTTPEEIYTSTGETTPGEIYTSTGETTPKEIYTSTGETTPEKETAGETTTVVVSETTTETQSGTTIGYDSDKLDGILLILQSIVVNSLTLEYITYESQTISVDFCITYLSLNGISIDQATVDNVYEAINVYIRYEVQYGNENLVFVLTLDYLKKGTQTGTVYYQGYTINLVLVQQLITQNGFNIESITLQEFQQAIVSAEESTSLGTTIQPETIGNNPTQQQTELLQDYIILFKYDLYDIGGSIQFAGHSISIKFIITYVKDNNIDISELTVSILFEIIRNYVSEIETTANSDETSMTTTTISTGTTIEYDSEQLEAIVKILQSAIVLNLNFEYITYENQRISVDFCLTYISIQGISIEQASVDIIYQAINLYFNYQLKYDEEIDLVFMLAVNTLKEGKNDGTVYYQGYSFSLQIVEQTIVQSGFRVENINVQQILQVIFTIQTSIPTTTPTPPQPLGDQPTEDEVKILDLYVDFFKSESYDISESILFAGYKVSIEYIIIYLNNNNIELSKLTSTVLYAIIRQYVNGNPTNPSTSSTPQMSQEEQNTLKTVLDDIKSSGLNSSTNITFDGHVISTSFFITYLSIRKINIQEVAIEQLYAFALEYIQIEQNVQGSNSGISIQEAVTVQVILNVLQEGSETGDIIYEGAVISKKFIFEMLLIQNITIETITYEKLYYIIYIYRVSQGFVSIENVQVPQNVMSSLNQILGYIEKYGEQVTGTFTINSKSISFQVIFEIIQASGVNIEKVDVRYIWIAIQILTVGETVDTKQALYENVIKVFQRTNEGHDILLTVNGINITVETLAEILEVPKDSEGKYDVSSLTADKVWEAVKKYLKTETVTEQGSSGNILEVFKEAVEEYNDGKSVTLQYQGQNFAIQDVIQEIGLEKDDDGHYNTDDVTQEQIIDALNGLTTTTPSS